ncbi:MAG: bacteriohopanetetrol glucosamine biosynthesis glycosyltransferase HpnI [Acidobacteriota bacterium]|nr:bacteriohopanetetrol glucosamine biosynthesis glycosyltransferase HpnI [Acidobacteriota bacterium]
MPHALALAVESVTTALAVAGMGYFLAAMAAARAFLRSRRASLAAFSPGVSILKSLKGLDPGMMDAFRSHCRQNYAGEFELLFGVSSLDDPAAAAVEQLKQEFPERAIRLVECPERLGSNGKVSTLVQLARHARHEYLLINDSDITVSPRYLERVMACFAPATRKADETRPPVGLVTALYRGRAHGTLASRLEALGIATDFMAGVLLSKLIEHGLHYGLGSTLAVRCEALEKSGGLLAIVDYLADDYELGARVARAGYRVALSAEVVETAIPAYAWRGFADHQLRWLRTVRSARPAGYAGLIFTHGLGWALLNLVASGLSPVSLWLLGMSFFLRLAMAMTVGTEVLGDRQVLATLWLLPLRDAVAMGLWVAGFAGHKIVWRGERFVLKGGRLQKAR